MNMDKSFATGCYIWQKHASKCRRCSSATKNWHVHDAQDASMCSTGSKIPNRNQLYQKNNSNKSKNKDVRTFKKNGKRTRNKRKKLPSLDSRWITEPPKIADILQVKLTRIQIVRRNRERKGLDRSAKMERKNNLLSNTAAKSDHIVDRFTKTKKNRRNYSKKHEKYLKF